MNTQHPQDPLHGIKLTMIMEELLARKRPANPVCLIPVVPDVISA